MSQRYIRASELRSFSFCHRAWFLEQAGHASVLVIERERGRADHQDHERAVANASSFRHVSSVLFALALLVAVAALLWWVTA